ncbi:hypothetical protein FVE85_8787 [Porphyridium purpureum]|uniref:Uncharacterized protein n=1 Tax=Porphyridium purpureum TaxID=35688 RepID=A0A5J4YRB1_PORPP|nr:hypothetical protein FVE85_8787 [Porphyridium purpureum]|eukprot:POR1574..scf296_7
MEEVRMRSPLRRCRRHHITWGPSSEFRMINVMTKIQQFCKVAIAMNAAATSSSAAECRAPGFTSSSSAQMRAKYGGGKVRASEDSNKLGDYHNAYPCSKPCEESCSAVGEFHPVKHQFASSHCTSWDLEHSMSLMRFAGLDGHAFVPAAHWL